METNIKQLVTVAHLEDFKTELLTEISRLFKKNISTSSKKWMKTSEVKKFLNVSSGTLQTMRKSGAITFTRIGGSLFYDPDDIQRMLEQNKVEPKQ